jgi:hypothetical protein
MEAKGCSCSTSCHDCPQVPVNESVSEVEMHLELSSAPSWKFMLFSQVCVCVCGAGWGAVQGLCAVAERPCLPACLPACLLCTLLAKWSP